ncbi:MAG TPA: histidine kinase [Opitutaceae bacterium]|nr:histidine kinase [Opitutaceae bacterium]
MNPLARFLGMALFLVLAALAALLAAPLWHHRTAVAPTAPVVGGAPEVPTVPAPPARAVIVSQRAALAVALVGVVLALGLVATLAVRPRSETRPPMVRARKEMDTLTRLAENSAAQSAELSRERDVRRRAEEDAQLKQQLLAQSVDEKIRLGRDLHDGIIQSLYAVGLTLETVRPLLRTDPDGAERRLEEIRTSLNGAIRDVRTYITGLAPENLRRASFSRGVTALFEQLRAGRSAEFEIKVDDEAAGRLSVEQNVEALQIAREAISNALRHGEATRITLRMHQGDGAVCLLVQDNGRGFDPAAAREGGHGLANMRARAERLGASLRVTSQPGEGSRVLAMFPTPQNPAA